MMRKQEKDLRPEDGMSICILYKKPFNSLASKSSLCKGELLLWATVVELFGVFVADDEWLNLSPERLDDMLNKLSGKNTSKPDHFNLEKMADSMNSFIDKVSSHEGAEFPKWVFDSLFSWKLRKLVGEGLGQKGFRLGVKGWLHRFCVYNFQFHIFMVCAVLNVAKCCSVTFLLFTLNAIDASTVQWVHVGSTRCCIHSLIVFELQLGCEGYRQWHAVGWCDRYAFIM